MATVNLADYFRTKAAKQVREKETTKERNSIQSQSDLFLPREQARTGAYMQSKKAVMSSRNTMLNGLFQCKLMMKFGIMVETICL